MGSKIKIYSTRSCPYCVKAKSYFTERELKYEEIDLTDKPAEIEELKNSTGHRTVPQIFVDDKFIGGYSDMMEKIESGELKLTK